MAEDDTGNRVKISRRDLLLYLAVPATSFGGAGIALLLGSLGLLADPGEFGWGCVAGACILGYLSYTRPRRDIVSLLAPLYAALIFVVPLEIRPNLILQVLFAASISGLAIRLYLRFSTPRPPAKEITTMETYLEEYIGRLIPKFTGLSQSAAHSVASAFLSFKFGLYSNTTEEAEKAGRLLPDGPGYHALRTALLIVGKRAFRLGESDVTPVTDVLFTDEDRPYLAIVLLPDSVEDEPTLTLDNALLLLYSVAVIASDDDAQALEEHRKSALQILSSYKKALGV